MARALKGDASPITPRATLADGTRVAEAGALTREILARLLDDLIIVREAELRETLARLMLEEHIVAEGAGALALAAGRRVASRRKVAVVSGGNIDAAVFAQLLLDTRPRPPRPPRRRAADPFTAGASVPDARALAGRAPRRRRFRQGLPWADGERGGASPRHRRFFLQDP